MSELTEPQEGLGIIHFLSDDLCHHVSGMHIDGADGHDPLPVGFREVSKQQVDESVQLVHLFLVVVLEGCLVPFLQSGERYVDLCGPPHLGASQRDLKIQFQLLLVHVIILQQPI